MFKKEASIQKSWGHWYGVWVQVLYETLWVLVENIIDDWKVFNGVYNALSENGALPSNYIWSECASYRW